MKLFDFLRKIGIFRSGSVSWKGSAKDRPVEMIMDGVYDRKKDLITREDQKKIDQKGKSPKNKRRWAGALVIWGILLLFLLFSGGFSLAFFLGVLFWLSYFAWLKKRYLTGTVALTKVLVVTFGLTLISFVLLAFTPGEQFSENDSVQNSAVSQEGAEEITEVEIKTAEEATKIEIFLTQLIEETGLDFGEMEKSELLWNGPRVNLVLGEGRSITLRNASFEEQKKIEDFFLDLGWNHGTIGFGYTPPAGESKIGYASTSLEEQYQGIMCVIDLNREKEISVLCGLGPGG